MNRTMLILAMAAVIAIATTTGAQAFFSFGKHESVKDIDGVVSIPLAEVSDGSAHYYTFEAGKREINFFVLQSPDGVVRAAFDACDVCWRSRKGYTQDGDFMICDNCGQRFHSARINVEKGGCNPAPLSRKVEGDDLVIQRADILKGARYF